MPCPVCGKPAQKAYAPFCSRRCADVDLARWLREDYRIPGPPADLPMQEDDPEQADRDTPDPRSLRGKRPGPH